MLFKVYEKDSDVWWQKYSTEDPVMEEENAYVFDSSNSSDMEAFYEDDCYDKDLFVIKLVLPKVPSPETKIALEEAKGISKGE